MTNDASRETTAGGAAPAGPSESSLADVDIDALIRRASASYEAGHMDASLQLATEIARRRPDDVNALLAVAHALRELGRFDEALAALDRIAAISPGHVRAQAAAALTLFYKEDWPNAWRAFDVRFRLMNRPPAVTVPGPDGKPRSIPPWRGGAVPAHVLVLGEQGLGDCIQFARFLPLLTAAGAKVTCVVPQSLLRLLKTLDADVELRPIEKAGPVPGITGWLPLMHLPLAFGLMPDRFVPKMPYLRAEPELVARSRAGIGAEGFRIGIAWQGNPDPRIDGGRSAPLSAFAPLANIPGVRLVSLQVGKGLEQVAGVPFQVTTLDGLDAGPDGFVDSAAAMQCLDLVISVDTALAHLAGALAVPSIILLKSVGADWRWLYRREDTVWYPSVRLFRNSAPGAWGELLERVAADVRLRVQGTSRPV